MTTFAASKFGDGSASGAGNVTTQVHTHYGRVTVGHGTVGKVKTEGSVNELSFDVKGSDVSNETFPLLAPALPAGAVIEKVLVKVKEAFTLGGTNPTVLFGTSGSVATNGFVISEAQAEAAGTYDVTSTLTGTWAAPLAAATTVGIDKGGTSPTSAATGRLEVIVRYSAV
jgi:hypothetical protein